MRYDIRGKRENGRQCNLTVHCASTDEIWDCALQSQPDLMEIHSVNGAQFHEKIRKFTGAVFQEVERKPELEESEFPVVEESD